MFSFLLVVTGGACGVACRYLLGIWAVSLFGIGFPWGTFIVNVLGSLFMGLLIGWLALGAAGGNNVRLFCGIGFLGGFTTFSALSLELVNLIQKGQFFTGMGYAFCTVVGGVIAVFMGLFMARMLG